MKKQNHGLSMWQCAGRKFEGFVLVAVLMIAQMLGLAGLYAMLAASRSVQTAQTRPGFVFCKMNDCEGSGNHATLCRGDRSVPPPECS